MERVNMKTTKEKQPMSHAEKKYWSEFNARARVNMKCGISYNPSEKEEKAEDRFYERFRKCFEP